MATMKAMALSALLSSAAAAALPDFCKNLDAKLYLSSDDQGSFGAAPKLRPARDLVVEGIYIKQCLLFPSSTVRPTKTADVSYISSVMHELPKITAAMEAHGVDVTALMKQMGVIPTETPVFHKGLLIRRDKGQLPNAPQARAANDTLEGLPSRVMAREPASFGRLYARNGTTLPNLGTPASSGMSEVHIGRDMSNHHASTTSYDPTTTSREHSSHSRIIDKRLPASPAASPYSQPHSQGHNKPGGQGNPNTANGQDCSPKKQWSWSKLFGSSKSNANQNCNQQRHPASPGGNGQGQNQYGNQLGAHGYPSSQNNDPYGGRQQHDPHGGGQNHDVYSGGQHHAPSMGDSTATKYSDPDGEPYGKEGTDGSSPGSYGAGTDPTDPNTSGGYDGEHSGYGGRGNEPSAGVPDMLDEDMANNGGGDSSYGSGGNGGDMGDYERGPPGGASDAYKRSPTRHDSSNTEKGSKRNTDHRTGGTSNDGGPRGSRGVRGQGNHHSGGESGNELPPGQYLTSHHTSNNPMEVESLHSSKVVVHDDNECRSDGEGKNTVSLHREKHASSSQRRNNHNPGAGDTLGSPNGGVGSSQNGVSNHHGLGVSDTYGSSHGGTGTSHNGLSNSRCKHNSHVPGHTISDKTVVGGPGQSNTVDEHTGAEGYGGFGVSKHSMPGSGADDGEYPKTGGQYAGNMKERDTSSMVAVPFSA